MTEPEDQQQRNIAAPARAARLGGDDAALSAPGPVVTPRRCPVDEPCCEKGRLGRGAEHAQRHLAGFSGVLQVDGYVADKQLTSPNSAGGPLVLAHCWSHFRRQFYDIAKGGNAPIAREALQRIAALYDIEGDIRGQTAETPRAIRQARTKELVDKLETWLKEQLARVSKGATIADALRYGLNHWAGTS